MTKAYLRIKDHLGPFICNNREDEKVADEILEILRLKKSFIWPYDPHGFICGRRQKYKLSPYIHHRILEIEQYANQSEWVEGTLIDQDSTQVEVDNVMEDLERRFNEDSFVQVFEETSSRKQSQETNTQPSEQQGTSERAEDSKKQEKSEQPEISEELARP